MGFGDGWAVDWSGGGAADGGMIETPSNTGQTPEEFDAEQEAEEQKSADPRSLDGAPVNHAPDNPYRVNSQGIKDFFKSVLNNEWNLPVLFFAILINQNEHDIQDTEALLEYYEDLYSGFNSLEQRLNGHPGGEIELLESEKEFVVQLLNLLRTDHSASGGWKAMTDDEIRALPGGALLLDLADGKADVPKSDGKNDGATELLALIKEAEQLVIPSYGNPETLGTKVGSLNEKRKSINDGFISYAGNYYSAAR